MLPPDISKDEHTSSMNYAITSLLTEHFGYPPLALIDDVINAVNDLLYKCTQGMETYLVDLRETREEALSKKGDDDLNQNSPNITQDEIKLGTAKLETLLESQVDKNFDKFELYALRNIFTLPSDLVEEGWVRLKHHEGIDFSQPREKKSQNDKKITELVNMIKLELHLRKILKLQITRANKVIKTLRLLQESLKFLGSKILNEHSQDLSSQAREAIKSLSPLDETLHFLLNQVEELVTQTRKISSKINGGQAVHIKFSPNLRDLYLDGKSIRILERIGILDREGTEEQKDDVVMTGHDEGSNVIYSSGKIPDNDGIEVGVVTISDIEVVKSMAEALSN